jgi:hypothetical protein
MQVHVSISQPTCRPLDPQPSVKRHTSTALWDRPPVKRRKHIQNKSLRLIYVPFVDHTEARNASVLRHGRLGAPPDRELASPRRGIAIPRRTAGPSGCPPVSERGPVGRFRPGLSAPDGHDEDPDGSPNSGLRRWIPRREMDRRCILIRAGLRPVARRAGSQPLFAPGAGAAVHPDVSLLEQDLIRGDVGPPAQSPPKLVPPGESPPILCRCRQA